ncbi:MAG: hypothetical protein NC299_04675 [Lachnospiraceae bacterium]|nr:hypothetical protein [Ruminococcus sp.]MCM1274644.1 hypothetical protein [Lachnospiraceae bacterium]
MKCKFISAAAEVRRVFINPRILTAGMLLIFIYSLVINELFLRADKTGYPVNAAESFIAVGSSGMLLMFLPSVFLILISDFPDTGAHTLYSIYRMGRIPWLLGKLIAVFICDVIYVVGTLAACCLMTSPKGFWGAEWSDTVTKYASMFPDERGTLMSQYLPSNLFNQMSLTYALINTVLLLILYLFLLSLIIIFFRIRGMRAAGIASAFAVIAAGVLTCAPKADVMWAFPMANTITWLHYDAALSETVTPMYFSYIYFAVLITLGVGANIAAVKKIDITTEAEQ